MNEFVKNKYVYGLIGLVVIALIVWIIAGTSRSDSGGDVQVNQETYTMETQVSAAEQSESGASSQEGYFVVRAEGEEVNVYWVDETGEHLHRSTSIAFHLLSGEDQQMLEDGVKLETDEELASFLENYDS